MVVDRVQRVFGIAIHENAHPALIVVGTIPPARVVLVNPDEYEFTGQAVLQSSGFTKTPCRSVGGA